MDDVLKILVMIQDLDEINPIKMNQVFANSSEEKEIYPLTVKEIVAAQKADFNRLIAMVAYLRPPFFLASYELNKFSNFCSLSTFDS
jgi:hypothetical protein